MWPKMQHPVGREGPFISSSRPLLHFLSIGARYAHASYTIPLTMIVRTIAMLFVNRLVHKLVPGGEGEPVDVGTRTNAGFAASLICIGLNIALCLAKGIAGLLAAVQFIRQTGLETIRAHELALARRFYEGVRTVPGVTVYGDFSTWERAPVVSLNIGDFESSEAADELAETYDIATRAGAHCAPRMHRALGTEEQGAGRFSFGFYNTEQETDAAIRAVQELAAT